MNRPFTRQSFGSKPPSQADRRTQLKMLLASARSIDGFTVESLRRMYGLPEKETEYELTCEQGRRARA